MHRIVRVSEGGSESDWLYERLKGTQNERRGGKLIEPRIKNGGLGATEQLRQHSAQYSIIRKECSLILNISDCYSGTNTCCSNEVHTEAVMAARRPQFHLSLRPTRQHLSALRRHAQFGQH